MVMRAVAWELNPKDPRWAWWASVHQNVENTMSEQRSAESPEHTNPVQRQANKGVWSSAMTMGNKKETSFPKVWLNIFRKRPEVSLTSHSPPGRHCATQGVALTATAGSLQSGGRRCTEDAGQVRSSPWQRAQGQTLCKDVCACVGVRLSLRSPESQAWGRTLSFAH